jgi:acyl carrier protein
MPNDRITKAATVSSLSPGENLGRAVIFTQIGRGILSQIKASNQETRRMSVRETLRTTLVNLLEDEMGEKYPLPSDDQDLRSSLRLDSVDLVGLVMRIEREFRVRLSPEELATVQRVGDLLDLMEAKLTARPDGSSNEPGRPVPSNN